MKKIRPIKRKRAKKMLPIINMLITSRALSKPEKKRELLADELIEYIKKQFPKEIPPVLETVVKKISKARNSSRDEDKPWHLSTLDDYPISSKTIAQIFELKTQGLQMLTIRDAEWLDRLSSIPLPLDILSRLAQLLSLNERYSEISKIDFDTGSWEKSIESLLENPEDRESMMHIVRSVPEGLDVFKMSEMFRGSLKSTKKEVPK